MVAVLAAIEIPGLLLILAFLWWRLGSGPRSGRTLRRLRQLLKDGNGPKRCSKRSGCAQKGLPRRWQKSFCDLEADCLDTAVKSRLRKGFDEA